MTLVKYRDIIDLLEHPLVETGWLAVHIADNNLHIVDMRWRGDESGSEVYRAMHTCSGKINAVRSMYDSIFHRI
jgi:hypothetical protein